MSATDVKRDHLPDAESSGRIDFEQAVVLMLPIFPPQRVLVVSGMKSYANMKVELVPRVYVRQPEFWGIEVRGRLPGVGLPMMQPYSVSLGLAGITGSEGIEVIGASRSVRIPLDDKPRPAPALPNLYELRGDHADVRLFAGPEWTDRELHVRIPEHDRSFSGTDIRIAQTEAGRLVTATLAGGVDEPVLKFNLLVPPVDLGRSLRQGIDTLAIISTHRDAPFLTQPAVVGQGVDYRVLSLSGSASLSTA